MTNVNTNRIITASTKRERLQSANGRQDNKITKGKSNGWSLIYCNGHEGEQMEFVQVLGYAKGYSALLLKPVEACWPPSTTSS